MKLFISSYRAGKHDNDLQAFVGKINKVGVITNAKDWKTKERKIGLEDNFNWWRLIGLEPTEIDLRPYFHRPGAEKIVEKFDFVWLAGGNVFLLRRALKYSGIDKYLGNKVRRKEVILGRESADAIIMGPTLKYSETEENEDNPNYIPKLYEKQVIWGGLDLINYVTVPHYKTPGYIGIDEYAENLKKEKIPYKTMTDDQAIIINGFDEKFLA